MDQEADPLCLQNARKQEVRALAALLAFRGSMDMKDILSACSWACHSTFTDFFNASALLTEGLHRLGSLLLLRTPSHLRSSMQLQLVEVLVSFIIYANSLSEGCPRVVPLFLL